MRQVDKTTPHPKTTREDSIVKSTCRHDEIVAETIDQLIDTKDGIILTAEGHALWLLGLHKKISRIEKRQDRIEKLTGLPIGKEE